MMREWWMRLVLPLAALVLAVLIHRLVFATHRPARAERAVLALLTMIVLAVTGWCIASWLLFSDDVLLQASPGRRPP
jgi:hypothetical protein